MDFACTEIVQTCTRRFFKWLTWEIFSCGRDIWQLAPVSFTPVTTVELLLWIQTHYLIRTWSLCSAAVRCYCVFQEQMDNGYRLLVWSNVPRHLRGTQSSSYSLPAPAGTGTEPLHDSLSSDVSMRIWQWGYIFRCLLAVIDPQLSAVSQHDIVGIQGV